MDSLVNEVSTNDKYTEDQREMPERVVELKKGPENVKESLERNKELAEVFEKVVERALTMVGEIVEDPKNAMKITEETTQAELTERSEEHVDAAKEATKVRLSNRLDVVSKATEEVTEQAKELDEGAKNAQVVIERTNNLVAGAKELIERAEMLRKVGKWASDDGNATRGTHASNRIPEFSQMVEGLAGHSSNIEAFERSPEQDGATHEKSQEAELAKKTNIEETIEQANKEKRILEMYLDMQETMKLFEEAEKTLDLLDESENVLKNLQVTLNALRLERSAAQRNRGDSQEVDSAVNNFGSKVEDLNVITTAPEHLVSENVSEIQISYPSQDQTMANVSSSASVMSDPSGRETNPVSRPTLFQRIRDSVREQLESYCVICACSLCLLCILLCRKS